MAIKAMTNKMWIKPGRLNAKYPSAQRITRMTAMKYNKLPMALNFEFEKIVVRIYM
jgi:hypothetical protein